MAAKEVTTSQLDEKETETPVVVENKSTETPVTPETPTPTETPTELSIQTPADAKVYVDERIADFLEEPAENKVEQKAKTLKEQKSKTPKKPETPKEPIDVDAVKKEVIDDLVKKLQGEVATVPGKEVDDRLTPAWIKDGRENPKDWVELAEYVDKVRDLQSEAKQAEVEKETTTQVKQWNDIWDVQLTDLRTRGKLPPVKNKEDKLDAGVVAENQVLAQMLEFNNKKIAKGETPTYNVKEFYYEEFKDPAKQPAGDSAPITGPSTPITESDNPNFTYEDIHNSDMADLIK